MISLFIVAIPIIIAAAAICLAIIHFTHPDGRNVSFNTVFATYFYTVAIISLLAVFIGAGTVGKALLSDAFGRDFSYESTTSYSSVAAPAEDIQATQEAEMVTESVESITQQEKDRIQEQYQQDILTGVSLLVVGLLFLVTHVIGWRIVDQSKPQPSYLYKAYMIAQLAIYSLITIVALTLAISQTLRFWLQADTTSLYPSIAAPGQAVAAAVVALPLWLFFIWKTIKLSKHS